MKMLRAAFAAIVLFVVPAAYAQTPANVPVSVSWDAPTQFTDGAAIAGTVTYKVYAGARGAANKALWITTTTRTASGNQPPGTCFNVTATVDGIESDRSIEACLGRKPAPPGGLIVTTTSTTTTTQTTVAR